MVLESINMPYTDTSDTIYMTQYRIEILVLECPFWLILLPVPQRDWSHVEKIAL